MGIDIIDIDNISNKGENRNLNSKNLNSKNLDSKKQDSKNLDSKNLDSKNLDSKKIDSNKIIIRKAVETDIELVLQLIKEHSVYQKAEDEVTATQELLTEWIIHRKIAEVLLEEYDGRTVGYVLFFYNFSTFLGKPGIFMEDIFVRKGERGKGFGKALIIKLANIAVERKCGRLDWACGNWNTPSIEFYMAMGADKLSHKTLYRLEGNHLILLSKHE